MNIRFPFSLYDIKDSLWYRPAIMTTLAIILSFATIGLDHVLFRERRVDVWWLFEGGSEGARGVLSAIAGTMMTVATTAFSFTLVALQLSSSQYSPRIVRNFTGDRVNQLVIGAFVATFVYTLLVLRVVRSESSDLETFVPAISVSVALLLAMICMASLIFFFHHATRTIQASVIITRTTEQAQGVIDGISSRNDDHSWRLSQVPLDRPSGLQTVGVVRGEEKGYVQDVIHDRVQELATSHNLLVEVNARPGDFLLAGDPHFTLWSYGEQSKEGHSEATEDDAPEEDENGDVIDQFRGLMELGLEQTLERDALYGLQQMADIAMRALSPGVNDPTTAIMCIDRMGELLVELEPISCVEMAHLGDDAVLRVIQPQVSWDEYVRTAFLQVRHYGAGDPVVATHILSTVGRTMRRVPPRSREPLVTVVHDMAQVALASSDVESDRQMIREERDRVMRQV